MFTRGPDAIALHGKWLVVVTALVAAMLALPLWVLAPRSLQLLALVVSVNVGAAAAVYSQGSLFGVGVPQLRWPAIVTIVVGLVTLAAGAFDVLRPKRTAMVLGSVAIIGGALFVDVDVLRQAPSDLSLWLALTASVGVLLVGDFVADRAVSGIGIVGLIGAVAEIVHRHGHGSVDRGGARRARHGRAGVVRDPRPRVQPPSADSTSRAACMTAGA